MFSIPGISRSILLAYIISRHECVPMANSWSVPCISRSLSSRETDVSKQTHCHLSVGRQSWGFMGISQSRLSTSI